MRRERINQRSYEEQTRTFAAVIFRRQSSKPRKSASGQTADLFLTLNEAERDAIRAKLLGCLTNETDNSVRSKVGDAVAELARQHTDEGNIAWRNGRREMADTDRRGMARAAGSPFPGQSVTGCGAA
jgi:hypothetical protein